MKQWPRRILVLCLLGLYMAAGRTALARKPLLAWELQAPPMEERLTFSADGKTATLFAPYVTRESGWYDANKNWSNDARLCWAASCSNVIAWYQDVCERTGYWDVSGCERDVNRIFDRFRADWDPLEGQDPVHGMNWYFTGGFFSGLPPEGYRGTDADGGWLRDMPHCGNTWFALDPAQAPTVFGDYEQGFPMLDDVIGRYWPGDPLYDHAGFSATIRDQLTYGAAVIGVVADGGNAGSSHAITMWGCDYDTATGLVTGIYVTDSDDEDRLPGHRLKRIGIRARTPDQDGIRMEGYYLRGSASPITEFLNTMVFFAPGTVVPPDVYPVSMEAKTTEGTVRAVIRNGDRVSHTVRLIRAFYHENGQLLSTAASRLELVPGQETSFPVLPPADAARCRCYALSETCAPLCPALEVPVQSAG